MRVEGSEVEEDTTSLIVQIVEVDGEGGRGKQWRVGNFKTNLKVGIGSNQYMLYHFEKVVREHLQVTSSK